MLYCLLIGYIIKGFHFDDTHTLFTCHVSVKLKLKYLIAGDLIQMIFFNQVMASLWFISSELYVQYVSNIQCKPFGAETKIFHDSLVNFKTADSLTASYVDIPGQKKLVNSKTADSLTASYVDIPGQRKLVNSKTADSLTASYVDIPGQKKISEFQDCWFIDCFICRYSWTQKKIANSKTADSLTALHVDIAGCVNQPQQLFNLASPGL